MANNPYQTPFALSEPSSRKRVPRWFLFSVLGMVSGICSGVSVMVKPWGIIAPGLIFGAMLVVATMLVKKVTVIASTMLFSVCGLAYFGSGVIAIGISSRFAGLGIAEWIGGLVGGALGSTLVGVGYAFLFGVAPAQRFLVITILVGSLFGALAAGGGVLISASESLGHPMDDFFRFVVWHTAVIGTIGFLSRELVNQNDSAEEE